MIENLSIWLASHFEWITGALVLSIATLIVWGFLDNANSKQRSR